MRRGDGGGWWSLMLTPLRERHSDEAGWSLMVTRLRERPGCLSIHDSSLGDTPKKKTPQGDVHLAGRGRTHRKSQSSYTWRRVHGEGLFRVAASSKLYDGVSTPRKAFGPRRWEWVKCALVGWRES